MKRLTGLDMSGLGCDILCHFPLVCGEEQAREAADMLCAMMDEIMAYRALGPVEKLSALVKAQNEGRVVVLEGKYTDTDGAEALRIAMYHCSVTNNPVTRYTADAIAEKLTRAEAESALQKGGPHEADPV